MNTPTKYSCPKPVIASMVLKSMGIFFKVVVWKQLVCNFLCILLFSPQLEVGSDEERKLNVR